MKKYAITHEDVQRAAERLTGIAHRTPVLTSKTFNRLSSYQVYFKCENLQRAGAFKFRGAYNTLAQLSDVEKERGVVAFSSGNHAQGIAYAAKLLGISATIVMPTDAPISKLQATREYGADVHLYDRMTKDRALEAKTIAEEKNAVLVPPFDHPHIMAGQGTVALELLQEVDDLDVLVIPVGGGGLLSGCATIAKFLKPGIKIYGVETERSNDWWQSFRTNERIKIDPPDTIADGMRTQQPGELTFPIVRDLVEDILLVSEEEVIVAMQLFLFRMKILVEPTGAVTLAAVLKNSNWSDNSKVGVVISGGNIDPDLLAQLLRFNS